MRPALPSRKSLMCLVVVISGLFLVTGSATAAWFCAQGNLAEVQNPAATDGVVYFGWGPDFTAKSGSTNWIHFPIPGPGATNKGARLIKVNIYCGSADVWVSDVHVYNGSSKVYAVTGSWSDGYKTINLDLGSVMKFDRGLSVSLKLNAGVESMSHRFFLNGACANFVNIPK